METVTSTYRTIKLDFVLGVSVTYSVVVLDLRCNDDMLFSVRNDGKWHMVAFISVRKDAK